MFDRFKVNFLILEIVLLFSCTIKGQLLYPPSAPTRYQFLAGFGVPVDLDLESVTIGYVFKAEYWLPINASTYIKILGDPFGATPMPLSSFGRKIRRNVAEKSDWNSIGYDADKQQKYEKYTQEVVEIQNSEEHSTETTNIDEDKLEFPSIMDDLRVKQPSDLASYRWTLYKGLAMLAETKGLPGRACVLRTICEAAHAPFTYSAGIFAELMRVILSPSSTSDTIMQHSDNEYLKAEALGRNGAPCEFVFRECTRSILDEISGMYDQLENMMAKFG